MPISAYLGLFRINVIFILAGRLGAIVAHGILGISSGFCVEWRTAGKV